MPTTDEEAALEAIAALDPLSDEQQTALTEVTRVIHSGLEEPFVDIHELFRLYNILYFRKLLLPRVEVSWSSRLTLCAGICELTKDDQGKYRRVRLKLSEPLLRFRAREDTINTLLHEAIHAYFFITTSWRHSRGDDGTGHGAGFLLLADVVNNHGNYLVTVYHTFHDEVDSYRTHVWQCNGSCRTKPPYFGLVRRSMNRPPSKSDSWWRKHEGECGGSWTKVAEPELTNNQVRASSARERAGRQKNKIDGWIKGGSGDGKAEPSPATEGGIKASTDGDVAGPKRRLGDGTDCSAQVRKQVLVTCPICEKSVKEEGINEHLDVEHPF